MRVLAQISSIVVLIIIGLLAVLFLAGVVRLESVKTGLWILTIVWFITASVWMWENNSSG